MNFYYIIAITFISLLFLVILYKEIVRFKKEYNRIYLICLYSKKGLCRWYLYKRPYWTSYHFRLFKQWDPSNNDAISGWFQIIFFNKPNLEYYVDKIERVQQINLTKIRREPPRAQPDRYYCFTSKEDFIISCKAIYCDDINHAYNQIIIESM